MVLKAFTDNDVSRRRPQGYDNTFMAHERGQKSMTGAPVFEKT